MFLERLGLIWSCLGLVMQRLVYIPINTTAAHTVPCIRLNNESVERVESFKLLGVTIINDLARDNHIAAVYSQANLTLLRRTAVSRAQTIA
jgi:hypothetical protein